MIQNLIQCPIQEAMMTQEYTMLVRKVDSFPVSEPMT